MAVFFDGDGSATLIEIGREAAPSHLSASHPHHGVAYPFAASAGPRTALSEALAAGERPSAVSLCNAAGTELARREDCPHLHGEGRSDLLIAFGCGDGVLLLDTRSAEFRKVANPSGTGNWMMRNSRGWRGLAPFARRLRAGCNCGRRPRCGVMRVVPLPGRRVHFALDPARADTGYAITEDGVLHAFSTLDGAVRARVQATGRYSLEGGAAVARPRLAAGGGLVAVSDPAAGRLILYGAETLTPRRVFETGGAPFDLRIVSLTGERH